MQRILISIFRIGLLRLSAGTYETTSVTAANLVNYLERFWPSSVKFGNVRKAFLLSLRGKLIANILRFLGRRKSKLVRKNSKKLPKLFHYGFTEKIFKQNRPECPFKYFVRDWQTDLWNFNFFAQSKQWHCVPNLTGHILRMRCYVNKMKQNCQILFDCNSLWFQNVAKII